MTTNIAREEGHFRRSLRATLYLHLEPAAWPYPGLSRTNRLVAVLIIVAVVSGVLETEASIRALAPGAFSWLEWLLITAFTVEYVARVYAAGESPRFAGLSGRLRYMTRFWSVVDLMAILPFLLTLGSANAFVLRLVRFFRLLRLVRLGRYSDAWDVLGQALHSRRHELAISGGVALVLLIFSSALLYLAEAESQPEAFGSIPRALWWSITTLTTVGYGDVAPVTGLGRMFAGFTAVAGIGLIAMPTGILAAAFSDVMQRRRDAAGKDAGREQD
jgi:voltage-gated potassium channel